VTRILAQYLAESRGADIPPAVLHEGTRSLLNWVGCTIGGSRHPAVGMAIAAVAPFSGTPEANLLGRAERLDAMSAALINGIGSHVLDFDDTHLKTIIHPAGPVASSVLALAQHQPVSGAELLRALVLGMETECRIGNAVYPSHYDMGWHITGTCGALGSAAACGNLLGLDTRQMINALGIAASQPVGLKIQFGSMTKSFHPGRAAQNGMLAALLAAQGFTADEASLEGRDGWGQALSRRQDWTQVTDGLGRRFEAALNTYKPFACGIVTHPGIDAAIQLRNEDAIKPDAIRSIALHANPLVLALTGKREPHTGLEGKFSIYHCIAVAMIQGAAGERQFTDEAVNDPQVVALRGRISVRSDAAVRTEQSDLTVVLDSGQRLTRHVEHAVGSLERPMSDAALRDKFSALSDGILPAAQITQAMRLCADVASIPDAGAIAQVCAVMPAA
jgi:2-methylcitrate dehydratase PrpD